MNGMTMTTAKQTFPSVTIEALPNGLLRLEDPTYSEGGIIDVHPAQVQVMAAMVGFTMPDKTRAALNRATTRLKALKAQMSSLEDQLRRTLIDQDADVAAELTAAEFIAWNLGELVHDLEAIQSPDLEAAPDALANPGGQLALPV